MKREPGRPAEKSFFAPDPVDGESMQLANDLVEFSPDPSQLARVRPGGPAGNATGRSEAPPAWVAMGLIAIALGLGLSLALPPATTVTHGAVASDAVSAGAIRGDTIRTADLHFVGGQ